MSGATTFLRSLASAPRLAAAASLAVAVLLTCCSQDPGAHPSAEAPADEMAEYVRTRVSDPARRDELLLLLEEYRGGVSGLGQAERVGREAAERLNADPDATREQFADLFQAFTRDRRQRIERLLEVLDSLKARTTDAEWAVLLGLERSSFRATLEYEMGVWDAHRQTAEARS